MVFVAVNNSLCVSPTSHDGNTHQGTLALLWVIVEETQNAVLEIRVRSNLTNEVEAGDSCAVNQNTLSPMLGRDFAGIHFVVQANAKSRTREDQEAHYCVNDVYRPGELRTQNR